MLLRKIYYRIYQKIVKIVTLFLRFPEPDIISGSDSVKKLPQTIKTKQVKKVLVVTDKVLLKLGLLEGLFQSLKENEVEYIVFDGVRPNPTIQNIEDAYKMYINENCEGIIAFGGGSSMDCAKVAAARVSNPNKLVSKMRGLFRVRKKLPPLFAVPTTSGTGSETTIAAVVTDPSTHEKYAINDLKLVPIAAVLDPNLMTGLPKHITSTTGMDALTHAVEAYIGSYGTKFTNNMAEKATKLIFENIERVYKNGKDIEARNNMALASYYGGAAFTRAYVGYVHAIAHTLGGLYGVPHGLANAVILPYVLEYSRKNACKKLAKLAVAGGIGTENETNEELSIRFINHIRKLNENMDIPTKIKEIKEEDITLIAKRALKEANPNYPVPTLMLQKDCEGIVKKLVISAEQNSVSQL